MKYAILIIFLLVLPNQENSPREIPVDLKQMGVSDFFEPDEILRIWRFPEGGAVFEELIEIKRNGKNWTSTQYTYLLEEYIDEPKFKSLRKRETLNLTSKQITSFVNKKLLHKDVNPTLKNQIFLSDLYLAEYRFNDQGNVFEFNIKENGNHNSAKLNLIGFLNKIITE